MYTIGRYHSYVGEGGPGSLGSAFFCQYLVLHATIDRTHIPAVPSVVIRCVDALAKLAKQSAGGQMDAWFAATMLRDPRFLLS